MELSKIRLKNFRGYRELKEFKVEDLNCLIGRNDVGKSTILEALDIFFNGKMESSDLCKDAVEAGENEAEITCVFSDVPKEMILDSSIETNLFDEGILNENGNLEIVQNFKIRASASKSIYLSCNNYKNENLENLLECSNSRLKIIADEKGIDISGIRSKNPLIRREIRKNFSNEKGSSRLKVDGNIDKENNVRKIWPKIKKILPIYSLFKVDKELNDKDNDVKSPLKSAVEETLLIDEIEEKLEDVQNLIKEKSTKVADDIIKNLENIDSKLSENLISDFRKEPSWKSVFDLTLLNDKNIPLNKRGSGVKRLVLLSFFQAQARSRKEEKNAPSIIYAVEEPETSQHPDHQFILIKALVDLSNGSNTQVLFTTHSSNLVREIPIESLRYIYKGGENKVQIENAWDFEHEKENRDTIENIIETLGVLPNPREKAKILVFVEGNNDVLALKKYLDLFVAEGYFKNLDLEEIAWVIAGGSALIHYVDYDYLKGLGKPEVHIYDNDKAEYQKVVEEINSNDNEQTYAFNTGKLELENYLHHQAINEYFSDNGNLCEIEKINDEDDVPLVVSKELYHKNTENKSWENLEEKSQKKKSSKKKKSLNKGVIDKMTIERLKERGGFEDLKSWFEKIEEFTNLN